MSATDEPIMKAKFSVNKSSRKRKPTIVKAEPDVYIDLTQSCSVI